MELGSMKQDTTFLVVMICSIWLSLLLIPIGSAEQQGSIVAWPCENEQCTTIPEGDNFVAIATTDQYSPHSLALTADGSIVAWGDNSWGQCTVPAGNNFIAIDAAGDTSYALRSDGSIAQWGRIFYTPPLETGLVALSGGNTYSSSLALRSNGTIVQWGGFLGLTPKAEGYKAVSAGSHGKAPNLAVSSTNSIVAWKNSDDCGYGLCNVPAGNDFIAVDGGAYHAVALRSDHSIVTWGCDGWCDLPSLTPSPEENYGISAIAAAEGQTLALLENGSLASWPHHETLHPPEGADYFSIATAGPYFNLALKAVDIPPEPKPVIENITFLPAIPVTGKKVEFSAEIDDNSTTWNCTGLQWSFINGTDSKVENTLGGKEDFNDTPAMVWPSGQYGKKIVTCTLFGEEDGTAGEPVLLDTKTIEMAVFFPMVEPGYEDWETKVANIPQWAIDGDNPGRNETRQPNWYRYWVRDGAVDGLNEFAFNATIGNCYNTATGNLWIGNMGAMPWPLFNKTTRLAGGGKEFFGGQVGIRLTGATVVHENRHKTISLAWRAGGPFNLTGTPLLDSDRVGNNNDSLPDDFENGTVHTDWEPAGSLTNWTITDTYDIYATFRGHYDEYGDEEYLCYRAENALGDTVIHNESDWSDYSFLAKQQKANGSAAAGPGSLTGKTGTQPPSPGFIFSEPELITSEYTGPTAITGPFADEGTDLNGNGLYDSLDVSVGIGVNDTSLWVIQGWLYDGENTVVAYTRYSDELATGSYSIPLRFNGIDIHANGVNGPYRVMITLSASGREMFELDRIENAHTTKAYTLSQFEGSQVRLGNSYSDAGVDTNGDGIFEYLQVDAGLTVVNSGTYRVSAALEKEGEAITSAFTTVFLDSGATTVPLLFDGNTIGASGLAGPYRVKGVTIQDTGDRVLAYSSSPWTTAPYSISQFRMAGFRFNGTFAEYGVDTNGNNLFDTLSIDTGVEVTVPGTYLVSGVLFDTSNRIIDQTSVQINGSEPRAVILAFNGSRIRQSGMNGPYTLALLTALDGDGRFVDYLPQAYETAAYPAVDFEGPPIIDTTAPDGITDLHNTTYAGTYINWSWTDPTDADFSHVLVYLDTIPKPNVTKGTGYYNATLLTANTDHTISTRTVDYLQPDIPLHHAPGI